MGTNSDDVGRSEGKCARTHRHASRVGARSHVADDPANKVALQHVPKPAVDVFQAVLRVTMSSRFSLLARCGNRFCRRMLMARLAVTSVSATLASAASTRLGGHQTGGGVEDIPQRSLHIRIADRVHK